MNDRVMVEIDAALCDLVPAFLARKRADADAIAKAVERFELPIVVALAHRLRGEGGSYGFDAISAMAAELESAAASGDRATARVVASKIMSYLDRVEVIYESANG